MAAYTNNVTMWTGRWARDYVRLWADDENELFTAGLEAGAELDQYEANGCGGGVSCFYLTADQQALAIFNGAIPTDALGPRECRAKRENDQHALNWIEDARRRLREHEATVATIKSRRCAA